MARFRLYILSAISVAEINQGIYPANTPGLRYHRRAFHDELKATTRFDPSTTHAARRDHS